MLDAELDCHLDNSKHEKTANGNYRNCHGIKKIKSSFGEAEIKVHRDREGNFEPVLFPKRHKSIIISLYTKGMNVSDIENHLTNNQRGCQ